MSCRACRYRQWVLTVPHGLRAKLAVDPALTTVVLREFIAAVSVWLRRRARRLGIRGALKTGAVTMIQRFNSALDVAPHFHSLVTDGVYTFSSVGTPIFHPVPSPSDEDVAQVAAAVFRRVERQLAGRKTPAEQRKFVENAPLLVALAEASARGVVATGPRRGCRVLRVRGGAAYVYAFAMGRLCARVEALYPRRPPCASPPTIATVSHAWAGTSLDLRSRRIGCRSSGRASRAAVPRPWRDGTTAFRFTAHELIERLVAIVPRPRAHLARYHAVLAPAFAARSKRSCLQVPTRACGVSGRPLLLAPRRPRGRGDSRGPRPIWRFLEDILACTRCSGRLTIVAAVTSRAGVMRILEILGLPTEAPAFHAARPPPQAELPLDVAPTFEADPPSRDDFGA